MDVVPLDTSLVKGSHGLRPADPADGPLVLSDSAALLDGVTRLADLAPAALRHAD